MVRIQPPIIFKCKTHGILPEFKEYKFNEYDLTEADKEWVYYHDQDPKKVTYCCVYVCKNCSGIIGLNDYAWAQRNKAFAQRRARRLWNDANC